ncbi:MAG: hypothetical protein HC851_19920 [Acaryochloris sp. RU_4_1]|nr:hypothetical protein [Acaryochloris sp. RU_4_1]NJR56493.1 hypothetical protein [Acaryochloris sp. CRU_2_0]
MSTSLDQWQDLTGEIDESLDEIAPTDESDEDYSVTTKHTLATNPLVKVCFWGGIILVAAFGLLAIFWGVGARSNIAKNQKQQQQAAIAPDQQNSELSQSDQELVKKMLEKDTFDRQRNRQQIFNGKRPNEQNKPTQAPVTPARTVTPPQIIYRSAPPSQPQQSYFASTQPTPTFRVQRPVSEPQSEVDDPNAGYFTAPFVASAPPSAPSQDKSVKLTKSEAFNSNPNSKPLRLFTPPTQIASNSRTIPQSQQQQPLGNLSGSLKNPYLKQIVATASQAVIPVDTVVEAEIINRVSWIPENPGLARGKVVRLKLEQDLKDGAGDVIANRGTIALGTVTQATEQGLITVNLTQIGNKFIQSGAVEIHQSGDPTMIAKLEKKGGNSNFLKTALDIGIGGIQTMTSSLNRPTSQTALSNGDQTFLSTTNNSRNNTAAFVEGASNRIGEQLRESVSGPDQTAIGVFRFGGKVQLYFVQEVRL